MLSSCSIFTFFFPARKCLFIFVVIHTGFHTMSALFIWCMYFKSLLICTVSSLCTPSTQNIFVDEFGSFFKNRISTFYLWLYLVSLWCHLMSFSSCHISCKLLFKSLGFIRFKFKLSQECIIVGLCSCVVLHEA